MNNNVKKHRFLDFLGKFGESANFINTYYFPNLYNPPLDFESKTQQEEEKLQ